MKTIISIVMIFFVLIAIVLIHLTRDGVSLRTAPIIGASHQDSDYKNVARSVINRLFPDFQTATHVVIGYLPNSGESVQVIELMKADYKKTFNKDISMLADNGQLTAENLKQCPVPCWITTEQKNANELAGAPLSQFLDQQPGVQHFHITIMPFREITEPSTECLSEKRLTFDCLVPISIYEARKKMKKPELMYFFMRKYQERDYFLFIQH